ncbi:ABC transporter permease [Saccharopolyspora sp. NFXS83]|uniref:ABC transporter permease n=1 Tax=Saccharopolyspora sp. NFXS83 TaxID=2993560 RepID=UPI00224A723A|nr:ABC transporter permease [Saccharopolyspora sp. NFXS83]MCX2731915.1 ABC transporter permease [Saccharopolyspora sp. NFXS83]
MTAAELPEPGAGSGRRVARWIASRAVGALIVLWAAASGTFLIQALMPGDRATLLLNQSSGENRERTPEELAPVNAQHGFDDPLPVQYWNYFAGLLRGDLGTSYQLHRPVLGLILEQITPTLVLACTALVLAWAFAVVVTVLTAGRGRWIAAIGSGLETVAAALPHYWLAAILLVVFAIEFQLFPVEGQGGALGLVLPALTLALPLSGFLGQVTRDEFTAVLDRPFVLSARARGMSDLRVRVRHVLRHSLLPAVSLSGWAIGALFSGAVIAETVFVRPGIGQVLVQAANSRDIPLVGGIVLFVAVVYVLANLIVDALHALIDPTLGDS